MVMEVVGSCYSPLGFNAGVISQAEERGFSTELVFVVVLRGEKSIPGIE